MGCKYSQIKSSETKAGARRDLYPSTEFRIFKLNVVVIDGTPSDVS
jgi:hypothetical protein